MTELEGQKALCIARDSLLNGLPDVWAIYVFGSFARGEEWPESDIDLAVLLPPKRAMADRRALSGELSSRIGRDVDLVDLRQCGDILRRQVLESGRTLYNAQPAKVLEWEANAMSRHARYREEIRAILGDFRRSGVGYSA
jgi:uncharacterized protein